MKKRIRPVSRFASAIIFSTLSFSAATFFGAQLHADTVSSYSAKKELQNFLIWSKTWYFAIDLLDKANEAAKFCTDEDLVARYRRVARVVEYERDRWLKAKEHWAELFGQDLDARVSADGKHWATKQCVFGIYGYAVQGKQLYIVYEVDAFQHEAVKPPVLFVDVNGQTVGQASHTVKGSGAFKDIQGDFRGPTRWVECAVFDLPESVSTVESVRVSTELVKGYYQFRQGYNEGSISNPEIIGTFEWEMREPDSVAYLLSQVFGASAKSAMSSEVSQSLKKAGLYILSAKRRGDHLFYTAKISDGSATSKIELMFDSGASVTTIPADLSSSVPGLKKIGRYLDFETANGKIRSPISSAEVGLGDIARSIDVSLSKDETALLGANFFRGLRYTVDIDNERILVSDPHSLLVHSKLNSSNSSRDFLSDEQIERAVKVASRKRPRSKMFDDDIENAWMDSRLRADLVAANYSVLKKKSHEKADGYMKRNWMQLYRGVPGVEPDLLDKYRHTAAPAANESKTLTKQQEHVGD